MIFHANLSSAFWAEAVATAVHIRNRVHSTAHSHACTPFQRWYRRKPDIRHLRVFGCCAYSHVPDQLRGKLDAKAEKLRFIGYATQAKGYRLLDPITGKVVIRRDVIFDEGVFNITSIPSETNQDSADIEVEVPLVEEHDQIVEPHESVPIKRSTRPHRQPVRFGIDEFVCSSVVHRAYHVAEVSEPVSFEEAMSGPQAHEWQSAAQSEYESLIENGTWDLVDLPEGRRALDSKWVFKAKLNAKGEVDRFKGRLVARGFEQRSGIDYNETFAPVIRYPSLRALLAHGITKKMKIHQMDVVTAFLHGQLDEEIYMRQPEGFIKPGEEHLVCKLKRSLYGLKQSPRCWNAVLDAFLKEEGFVPTPADQCVYNRSLDGVQTIIGVYVDDLVILSDEDAELLNVKEMLSGRFSMKDMGQLHYCLGMSVQQGEGRLKLSQNAYVEQILRKFGMHNCNPASTPMATDVKLQKDDGSTSTDERMYQSIIGSLMYLATATRPDISYAVGALSQFNSCPTKTHLTAAKRVLRYLKGTMDVGIVYGEVGSELTGYADASWADQLDDRHSTSGAVFLVSGGPISWISRRQSVVALSTAEAEYIALFEAVKEAVWLKQLCRDIGLSDSGAVTIHCDSTAAAAIANNSKSSRRVKHMDIKYHYVREVIADGVVATAYCPTAEMLADMLTKPLCLEKFSNFREKLRLQA